MRILLFFLTPLLLTPPMNAASHNEEIASLGIEEWKLLNPQETVRQGFKNPEFFPKATQELIENHRFGQNLKEIQILVLFQTWRLVEDQVFGQVRTQGGHILNDYIKNLDHEISVDDYEQIWHKFWAKTNQQIGNCINKDALSPIQQKVNGIYKHLRIGTAHKIFELINDLVLEKIERNLLHLVVDETKKQLRKYFESNPQLVGSSEEEYNLAMENLNPTINAAYGAYFFFFVDMMLKDSNVGGYVRGDGLPTKSVLDTVAEQVECSFNDSDWLRSVHKETAIFRTDDLNPNSFNILLAINKLSAPLIWRPEIHSMFPKAMRDRVRTVFLLKQRGVFGQMPQDALQAELLQYVVNP